MNSERRAIHEENLRKAYKHSKEHIEDVGSHPPILILLRGHKGQVLDFSLYVQDKDLMSTMLKVYQNQEDVTASIFVSEAWIIERNAPIDEKEQPSDAPDRQDALHFLLESDHGMIVAKAAIDRDSITKKVRVGPLEIFGDKNAITRGRLI